MLKGKDPDPRAKDRPGIMFLYHTLVQVQSFRSLCFYSKPGGTGMIADDMERMFIFSPLYSTDAVSTLASCKSTEN